MTVFPCTVPLIALFLNSVLTELLLEFVSHDKLSAILLANPKRRNRSDNNYNIISCVCACVCVRVCARVCVCVQRRLREIEWESTVATAHNNVFKM